MLNKSGWIYLIKENGDDALYKIGVTRAKMPESRLKKLQTGNGNKLILVEKFLSSKPFKLETMLHNKFQFNREEGEWFLLSQEDVDNFISICENFEQIIHDLKDNPFF